ncbi:hypothetical protein [Halomonas sp. M20]|uniref:hypothetical protein n=1 Tax=Halomonas sp. M20 TaxID=2763264 RepID=UPI001D0A8B86|nr:hypothetical protein [Halomonas sp. M20]
MVKRYVIRNIWGGAVIARIAEPSKARTVQTFMSVIQGRDLSYVEAGFRWIPWWWQGYRVVSIADLTMQEMQNTEAVHG